MIYLQLFYEFFKIGLFAVGGGMATLPFLQALSQKTGWFTTDFITNMIAISESTPGPIGINMATYVGFNLTGVLGGIVATLGTILPAIIIVSVVSRYLEKFSGNPLVDHVFYGLRPTVTGLIAAAGYDVMKVSFLHIGAFLETHAVTDLVDPVKLILFVVAFVTIRKLKKHPVMYIAIAAVVGVVFGL